MTTRKQRSTQHLVQVSTYIPYRMKLQLQSLAEAQDISSYELVKKLITDFIEKMEKKGLVSEPVEPEKKTGNDEELLG